MLFRSPRLSAFENDPATMTPEQRFQEVAAILARGVLRLRAAIPTRGSPASVADDGGTRSGGSGRTVQ